jgi:hypothetical protein
MTHVQGLPRQRAAISPPEQLITVSVVPHGLQGALCDTNPRRRLARRICLNMSWQVETLAFSNPERLTCYANELVLAAPDVLVTLGAAPNAYSTLMLSR